MYYALIGEDAPGTLQTRLAVRPEHVARLEALRDEGRLLLAGPMPAIGSPDPAPAGFTGSLIIAEFDSLASAEARAQNVPYMRDGVSVRIPLRSFPETPQWP